MISFDDLMLECTDDNPRKEDYSTEVCFEINKLEANYPTRDLQNLTSKLKVLMIYYDKILLDNEEKAAPSKENAAQLTRGGMKAEGARNEYIILHTRSRI